jgi:hypothetical protein
MRQPRLAGRITTKKEKESRRRYSCKDSLDMTVGTTRADPSVVLVQAQHRDSLSVSSQVSSHIAVFAAVVSLESESAVGSQLPLGAKTMRCLEQRNQQRGTNRTQIRNLT